jgi:hypothetical protein
MAALDGEKSGNAHPRILSVFGPNQHKQAGEARNWK